MLTTQSVDMAKQPIHKIYSPAIAVILDATGFSNDYLPAGTIIGADSSILDDLSVRGVFGNVEQGISVEAQGILMEDIHFNGQDEVVSAVCFNCVVYSSKIIDANGALAVDVKTTLEGNGITFYNATTTSVN